MEKIKLEGKVIELHSGRSVDVVPGLLEEGRKHKGVIFSEADIIIHGLTNESIRDNYWSTSTPYVTEGEDVTIILPREIGSGKLTDAAKYALGLINPRSALSNGRIDLDENGGLEKIKKWAKQEGSGVYTLQREDFVYNKDLTKDEARKDALILTKLGHSDYVDGNFIRPEDEVFEIIAGTFKLGKDVYRRNTMMRQELPIDISKKGELGLLFDSGAASGASSHATSNFHNGFTQFAFGVPEDIK